MLYRNLHMKDLPKVAFQTMKAILGILQGNKILDFPPKAWQKDQTLYCLCLNNLQDILPASTPRSSLSAASLSKSIDSLGFIKNNIIMRPNLNDTDNYIPSWSIFTYVWTYKH